MTNSGGPRPAERCAELLADLACESPLLVSGTVMAVMRAGSAPSVPPLSVPDSAGMSAGMSTVTRPGDDVEIVIGGSPGFPPFGGPDGVAYPAMTVVTPVLARSTRSAAPGVRVRVVGADVVTPVWSRPWRAA